MPNSLRPRLQWVFDLDNTLYPPEARLFDQIEIRMTQYVMDTLGVPRAEADDLRRSYWAEYGTTLAGLMAEHGVDPGPYLIDVHDITLDHLTADRELRAAIVALPGQKFVFTNGSAPYAERVLKARGLDGLFDGIFGVEHAEFHPKPRREAFEAVFSKADLRPRIAVMFEDDSRNLAVPHALGMGTVLVGPDPDPAPHVHFHTTDLTAFLRRIVA